MSSSSLTPVIDHLRNRSHPELTPKKVRLRAELVEDADRPEQIVFDAERHRGALGARYREGLPMAAFETYWQRYAFDPESESLSYLGKNEGDRNLRSRLRTTVVSPRTGWNTQSNRV